MWGRSSTTALTNQLDNPATKLEDILLDPNLNQMVRTCPPVLKSFLQREDILESILNIVFSDQMPTVQPQPKALRAILSFFTNSSMASIFLKSQLVKDRIAKFPDTEFIKSTRACANFATVVENLARSNGNEFFQNHSNIYDFLLQHLDMLPLKELFSSLTLDHQVNLEVNQRLVSLIFENEFSFFASNLVKNITKQKQDSVPIFAELLKTELLTKDVSNLDVLSIIEVFNLAYSLKVRIDEKAITDLFLSNEKLLAAYLLVFKTSDFKVLDKIATCGSIHLSVQLLLNIKELPDDKLKEFYETHQIKDWLHKSFNDQTQNPIYNGAIYDLIELFRDKKIDDEWKLDERITSRKHFYYGGTDPNKKDSKEDSDADDSKAFGDGGGEESNSEDEFASPASTDNNGNKDEPKSLASDDDLEKKGLGIVSSIPPLTTSPPKVSSKSGIKDKENNSDDDD